MISQNATTRLRNSAMANTPTPGSVWMNMLVDERIQKIINIILENRDMRDIFTVVDAKSDGQITVTFSHPTTLEKRSRLLLDLESLLKEKVDYALTVWLEPLGDRNTLRKLRGLEMK